LDRQVPAGNRARRWFIRAGCATGAVLVVLSPTFGRAHPSGNYRPALPPDALKTGCYPLPAGVHLDLELQVRSDEDLLDPARRRLLLQFDRIDAARARAEITRAFAAAGFRESPQDQLPADTTAYRKPGIGEVTATVRPIPDVTDDDLVRGTIELLLPQVSLSSSDPACADRFSTKRFAAWKAAR
jgi:hypothetical protein